MRGSSRAGLARAEQESAHDPAATGSTEGTRGATTARSKCECGVAGIEGTRTGGTTGTAEGAASAADATGATEGAVSAADITGTAEDEESTAVATPVRCRQAGPGAKTTRDTATTSASRGAGPAQYSGAATPGPCVEERAPREAGGPLARETQSEGAAAATGNGKAPAAATGDREAAAAAGGGPVADETAGRAPAATLITPKIRVSNRHQDGQNRRKTH